MYISHMCAYPENTSMGFGSILLLTFFVQVRNNTNPR